MLVLTGFQPSYDKKKIEKLIPPSRNENMCEAETIEKRSFFLYLCTNVYKTLFT